MDLAQLLALLGVATVTDAAIIINRMNTFLQFVMAATGTMGVEEAIEKAKTELTLGRDVRAALSATGADLMGKLEALKLAAAQSTDLRTQLDALNRSAAEAHAALLMDKATREGRLPPAMRVRAQDLYAKHGQDALGAFLEALPVSAVAQTAVGPTQPHVAGGTGTGMDASKDQLALAKALGRNVKNVLKAEAEWEQNQGIIDEAHLRDLEEKREQKLRSVSAA